MTEVEVTSNPFSEVLDTSEIDDGTSILPGREEIIVESIGMIKKALKSIHTLGAKLAKENKTVAIAGMRLAFSVGNPAGLPIMSMETGKASEYVKRTLAKLYDEAFPIPSGDDVSDAEKAAARKQRSTSLTTVRLYWGGRKGVGGMREAFATSYVLENLQNYNLKAEDLALLDKKGYLKWSDADPDFGDELMYLKVVPTFLKKPIGDLYRQSGLDVPEKFGGAPKDSNSQGTKDKKITAEKFQAAVSSDIVRFVPKVGSEALYNGTKAWVRHVLSGPGEIEDRGTVVANTETTLAILTLALKFLKSPGNFSEKDRETLDAFVEIPDLIEQVKASAELAAEELAAAAS